MSKLYNILKAHEAEVKKIVDEKEKTRFGGPSTLVSKTNVKDTCSDVKEGKMEEGLFVNSGNEVVAYY